MSKELELLVMATRGKSAPSMGIKLSTFLKLKHEVYQDRVPFSAVDFPYPNILVIGCEVFPIEYLGAK